ncbi:MAG: hypothetical protein CL605_09495 [Altibacter sp.]|uniref:hypothetical protein n=1 Tax=Altibacter sp. TaxID=2024823 RepID=UPI000C8BD115|nr:hypothetical protein [Altibacter sp.]MAP55123.1 hypothetical protein [Altibacter sp.]|tara:strand:+ start:2575 stop:3021 length:447 start_codon:yes stop_codon:yes gene_type:complete
MKKILLLSSTLILFISCAEKVKTKEERIRENIEAKLKPTMKDPASYEFVSMNINKTITVVERKKTMNEEYLNKVRELNEQLPSSDLLNQAETEYAFLQEQTDENKEAVYYVDFVAKGTNSFGGVVQNKYSATVLNDENLTVFRVSGND